MEVRKDQNLQVILNKYVSDMTVEFLPFMHKYSHWYINVYIPGRRTYICTHLPHPPYPRFIIQTLTYWFSLLYCNRVFNYSWCAVQFDSHGHATSRACARPLHARHVHTNGINGLNCDWFKALCRIGKSPPGGRRLSSITSWPNRESLWKSPPKSGCGWWMVELYFSLSRYSLIIIEFCVYIVHCSL
jgi:hypothetical protein